MYSFPIAVVINYHKLSGLEHHKFIILQLWTSEVLTSTCQQSVFLLEALREIDFLVFFQVLETACKLMDPFSHPSDHHSDL